MASWATLWPSCSQKDTVWHFDNMSNSLPRFVQFTNISQSQFITLHKPHIIICFRKCEVCNPFLVQTDVPAYNNVILSLQIKRGRVDYGLSDFHRRLKWLGIQGRGGKGGGEQINRSLTHSHVTTVYLNRHKTYCN